MADAILFSMRGVRSAENRKRGVESVSCDYGALIHKDGNNG